MAAELTAVLFALAHEAGPFRRRVRCRRRGGSSPCPVWQCGDSLLVLQTGMGAAATERAVGWLLREHRPARVLSAGFCGGLAPDVGVGQIVRPERVVDEAGRAWALGGQTPVRRFGTLLTAAAPVLGAAERRRLHEQTGAVAVDMESAAAARLCASAGAGFDCVRVASDGVQTPLPAELARALRDGRLDGLALAAAVWRRPGLIGELWRLAGQTRRAADALADGVQRSIAR